MVGSWYSAVDANGYTVVESISASGVMTEQITSSAGVYFNGAAIVQTNNSVNPAEITEQLTQVNADQSNTAQVGMIRACIYTPTADPNGHPALIIECTAWGSGQPFPAGFDTNEVILYLNTNPTPPPAPAPVPVPPPQPSPSPLPIDGELPGTWATPQTAAATSQVVETFDVLGNLDQQQWTNSTLTTEALLTFVTDTSSTPAHLTEQIASFKVGTISGAAVGSIRRCVYAFTTAADSSTVLNEQCTAWGSNDDFPTALGSSALQLGFQPPPPSIDQALVGLWQSQSADGTQQVVDSIDTFGNLTEQVWASGTQTFSGSITVTTDTTQTPAVSQEVIETIIVSATSNALSVGQGRRCIYSVTPAATGVAGALEKECTSWSSDASVAAPTAFDANALKFTQPAQ